MARTKASTHDFHFAKPAQTGGVKRELKIPVGWTILGAAAVSAVLWAIIIEVIF